MTDSMGRKDVPELEAAFNLLRQIYWREYGRGWREAIAKIRNIAADPGPPPDVDCELKRCAECACDDPPSQCDWIKPK